MFRSLFISAATVIAFAAPQVQAAPVIFGSNAYELIIVSNPYTGNNNSWATASSSAQASTFLGVNGHLATVTSVAENDFLAGLAIAAALPVVTPGFSGAWLGGRAGTGWLTGPENGNAFTFDNFGGSEPNNNGFAYMAIALSPGVAGLSGIGEWLDDSVAFAGQGVPSELADPVIGYFVEYENVVTTEIHAPAGLPMLMGGLGLLALWRRRR